jgi:hypothetical protein
MTARWAQVVRGWTIAGFATFAAALSHTLGGGAAPGLLPVIVSLAFAGLACIGLVGRSHSAGRVTAAVLLSQFVFHGLFSLGVSGGSLQTDAPAGTLPAHTHASGSVLLSMQSGATTAPGPTGAHAVAQIAGMSAAPLTESLMWFAHLAAALLTVLALRHGERAIRAVAESARLVVRALVVRALLDGSTLPVRTRAAHRAPAPDFDVLPRTLGVLLSVMRHRGPPASLCFAETRPSFFSLRTTGSRVPAR